MAAPILLTLAGRSWVGSSFTGGAVVQLGTDGTWRELVSGDTVAWNLQNFECAGAHVMFHIRSAGFYTLNSPDRGQLYRSVDKGATWADVTPSSGSTEYASDVAMDADKNFWCITSELAAKGTLPNNQPCRIYKSADYGVTWTLSHLVPETSATTRNWPAFNITCHPTDPDIILVEGTEMIGWGARLWRTTDGGGTWSAAFMPTIEQPPSAGGSYGVFNIGGAMQHVFDYTLGGDLVYAGIFETSNDTFWVLKSLDDGSNFGAYAEYDGSNPNSYGAAFQEATLAYILSRNNLSQSAASVGQGQITEIASNADAPWGTTNYIFHGLSRHAVGGVDTLHVGVHLVNPGVGATDDPSVWTRPADLASGWVQHPSFATMDSDLGYRLYVAIDGIVGATELELDVPRPRPPDEPPGGGGPIGPLGAPPGEPSVGDPGVGEPGRGQARRPERDLARRRRRLGREDATKPRRRQPLMITDRIDKSQIPQTAAEPTARRWMPFGWLAGAVTEGHKTMTLRGWDPIEGVQWNQGELFYAYDQPPSEGGRRLALLRVAAQPYSAPTSELGKADFLKLGYGWAQATRATPPSGRAVEEMWADMQSRPQRLWVVRFTLERLYDQRAPERSSVRVAG